MVSANWLCAACGVEYPEAESPPDTCPICQDERQYVPRGGQSWTSLQRLAADGYSVRIGKVEPDLYGISAVPQVGIGQRGLLLRTPDGNLLWDPPGFVDEAGAEAVRSLGGARYIATSHPHMFGAQLSWASALGGAQVLVSEPHISWLQRTGPLVQPWRSELEIFPGLTLRAVGGHFAGSAVAHWDAGAGGRGAVLAGDTVFPNPNGTSVSFLRSFPNQIPLSAAVVARVTATLTERRFAHLYGNLGNFVDGDADGVVRRSAARYIAWVRGEFDSLTSA